MWRKSSRSNGGGNGNCVEVALAGSSARVRDSKNPTGPTVTLPNWQGFLAAAKRGTFTHWRHEPGTAELLDWLNAADRVGSRRVSSVLAEVELSRALRRSAPAALASVPLVLSGMYLVEPTPVVRQVAASFSDPLLRSLGAVHLATAQVLAGQVAAFVAYDKRLLEAAAGVGLRAVGPGAYDA